MEEAILKQVSDKVEAGSEAKIKIRELADEYYVSAYGTDKIAVIEITISSSELAKLKEQSHVK